MYTMSFISTDLTHRGINLNIYIIYRIINNSLRVIYSSIIRKASSSILAKAPSSIIRNSSNIFSYTKKT